MVQLLEDVATYQSDLNTKKLSAPKRKDELDRQKSLQMRNAAMVTHSRSDSILTVQTLTQGETIHLLQ